ncbi:MAG: FAD-dependent monooxygenase [Candidatus Thermoplasmatota archaeon]|nr:FAD-dependent monooxygenase [Candidatus Thermoplasmatota archaeon]
MFDCIVIGCGPSGSNLGRILSEHGMKVAVLDRRIEIGSPVRTDGLVNIQDLEQAGLDADALIRSRISSVRFSFQERHIDMHASGNRGDAFNASVEIDKLHKEMAALSALAGSNVYLRTEVKNIKIMPQGLFDVSALQMGKLLHMQSELVVLAGGGWDFIYPESDPAKSFGTRVMIENFHRRVANPSPTSAELRLNLSPGFSMGVDFPFTEKMIDHMTLEMRRDNTQGKEETGCLISGHRKITVPEYPLPVYSGLPVIGVQAGLWNPLFLTGFSHAIGSSSILADLVLSRIHNGKEEIPGMYANLLKGRIISNLSDEMQLVDALEHSTEERISAMFEEISDLDFSEVSLREILEKSGMKLDGLISKLRAGL